MRFFSHYAFSAALFAPSFTATISRLLRFSRRYDFDALRAAYYDATDAAYFSFISRVIHCLRIIYIFFLRHFNICLLMSR